MAVHYSSKSVEWSTPQWLFDRLNSEFHFTLDVCATPENAKCERYITEEVDGLKQLWTGTCWMNPPHAGRGCINPWIEKAMREAEQDNATVVALVPARPGSPWFFDHCSQGEIRFLRSKLTFGGMGVAPFNSAVVIFHPGLDRKGVKFWKP
jgi:phage N-6-adenine-methyltransferase